MPRTRKVYAKVKRVSSHRVSFFTRGKTYWVTKPFDEYHLIWVVDETNKPRMVEKNKFEIIETYDPPKTMEITKMRKRRRK